MVGWKKALFYEQLDDGKAKCTLCHHYCIIPKDETGFCHAYMNVEGDLYSMTYGRPIAVLFGTSFGAFAAESNPVIRWQRHLEVSTAFCNFRCKLCPNSKVTFLEEPPFVHPKLKGFHCFRGDESKPYFTIEMSPEDVVAGALTLGCDWVRFAYNECTVFFEYLLDIARLAKKAGIKVSVETNGYMTEKPLEMLAPYVDVVVVSFKASGSLQYYDGVDVPHLIPRFETVRRFKQCGVFTIVINVLVEGLDSPETVGGFCRELASWFGTDQRLLFSVAVNPKLGVFPPIKERQEKFKWALTCAYEQGLRYMNFVETIAACELKKQSGEAGKAV